MQRFRLLTILCAGLLAATAVPAAAGTITFEGHPGSAGDAIGTVSGVTFTNVFVDRDEGAGLSGVSGTYGGLAAYFSSNAGETVATNYSLGFDSSGPRYGNFGDLADSDFLSPITVDFGSTTYHNVSFDFIAIPGTDISVELFTAGGVSRGTGSFSAVGGSTPGIATASMTSALGFNKLVVTLPNQSRQVFAMNDLTFGVAVVPLPPAVWMGILLLGGLGLARRLRRRRRTALL